MKDPFDNVYPTLVECFGIVFIGYLCARLSLLSQNQANGIQIYISKVALPAIIFKSMLELDFSQVSWAFWLGILIAKSILFTFVSLFSLLLNKPVLQHAGKAGIFAIFVTQSNDLALGLPLCKYEILIVEPPPPPIFFLESLWLFFSCVHRKRNPSPLNQTAENGSKIACALGDRKQWKSRLRGTLGCQTAKFESCAPKKNFEVHNALFLAVVIQ